MLAYREALIYRTPTITAHDELAHSGKVRQCIAAYIGLLQQLLYICIDPTPLIVHVCTSHTRISSSHPPTEQVLCQESGAQTPERWPQEAPHDGWYSICDCTICHPVLTACILVSPSTSCVFAEVPRMCICRVCSCLGIYDSASIHESH